MEIGGEVLRTLLKRLLIRGLGLKNTTKSTNTTLMVQNNINKHTIKTANVILMVQGE